MDVDLSRARCAKLYCIPFNLILCQINDQFTGMLLIAGVMLGFGNSLGALSDDPVAFGQTQMDLNITVGPVP